MSDEARKRAEELIVKSYPSWPGLRADPPIIDAMLRFSDERLEMAAKHIEQLNRRALSRAVEEHCASTVRRYKSTPPPPPETREQRLERALAQIRQAIALANCGATVPVLKCWDSILESALEGARTEEGR